MLTAEKTAEIIGMSASWLAKARMKRQGPPWAKIGKAVRYREEDVLIWLASRTRYCDTDWPTQQAYSGT